MRVNREFAPMTIVIQTAEDLAFFRQLLEAARKGSHNRFYFPPHRVKTQFELTLEKMETELFYK